MQYSLSIGRVPVGCTYVIEAFHFQTQTLPARLPDDTRFHSGQRKPEEQHGVVDRHPDPFPELAVVEQLGALGGAVQGGVGLSRDVGA